MSEKDLGIQRVGDDMDFPDLGQGPLGYEGVHHVSRTVSVVRNGSDETLQTLNLWGKNTEQLNGLEDMLDKIANTSGEEREKLKREFEEKTGRKITF